MPRGAEAAGDRNLDAGVGAHYIYSGMTPREKLNLLVEELSDVEPEAVLAKPVRERELLQRWAAVDDLTDDADATEDVWALANARDAIREERW